MAAAGYDSSMFKALPAIRKRKPETRMAALSLYGKWKEERRKIRALGEGERKRCDKSGEYTEN